MATQREIKSNIAAYAHSPWGEDQNYDDVREWLTSARERSDGFVYEYRQSPGEPPYLYIHGIDYGKNIAALIDNEITGSQAYWQALDGTKVVPAISECKTAAYINNIHADKSVGLMGSHLPRLKILPELILDIMHKYDVEAVILFTHRATGVFESVGRLDKDQFKVTQVDYKAQCTKTKFNIAHKIDYLSLLIIRRK